jgi:hypothetical protein
MVEEPRQIGIRQSRQVEGEYVLTADDITHRRQFDDVIAQCCFNVDVHAADTEVDAQAGVEGGRLESGEHYDIPLRSLVPASGPSNLLVAGRCISATPEAMSSFRVSPSVMAIGEAAGVTAALAAEAGDPVGDVPADRVQHHLRHTGAVLD